MHSSSSRRQRLISMNNIGTPARMYKYVKRKLLNYSLLGARENFKDQHFSPPTKLLQSTWITSKSSPKLQRWWTKKIPKIIIPRQIPSSQDFWLLKNIFSKVFFKRYRVSVPPRLSSISFGMDQCLFIVIMTGITICDWQVWLGLLMFWSIRLGNHKKTKDSGARRPRAVFLVSSSFEVGKVWYEKFCTRTIAVFFKVESTEIHTLKNPQICN